MKISTFLLYKCSPELPASGKMNRFLVSFPFGFIIPAAGRTDSMDYQPEDKGQTAII